MRKQSKKEVKQTSGIQTRQTSLFEDISVKKRNWN